MSSLKAIITKHVLVDLFQTNGNEAQRLKKKHLRARLRQRVSQFDLQGLILLELD